MASDRILGLIVLQLAVLLLYVTGSNLLIHLAATLLGTASLVVGLVFVFAPRESNRSD